MSDDMKALDALAEICREKVKRAVAEERKAGADLLMELSKIAATAKVCMTAIEEPIHAERHRIRSETFAQAAAAISARGEQT